MSKVSFLSYGLSQHGSRRERFARRRFLGGTGAALMLGLPLLESLCPRGLRAQEAVAPRRLVCVASGSGLPMDEFIPSTTGLDYALPPLLKSMASIKNKLNVMTGLGIDEGAHTPGDHGAGVAVTFTCTTPKPTHGNSLDQDYKDAGAAFGLGVSFDQLAAQAMAAQTRIPSLQLGLREGQSLGDGPFSPVYLKNLSWASATQPLSAIVEPRAVFDQLFAGFDPNATAAENARRLARSISVLDYVAEERSALLPALSASDAQRMDQYFTAAREVEVRLAAAQGQVGNAICQPGVAPTTGLDYPATAKAMADLAVLAMQCDATRIIMLQLSCYRNDTHFGFLDASDNHHSLSHAGDWSEPDSDYRRVCRWLMDQVGYLFTKMDGIVEPTGTLLDNSLAVYNNDCGVGDAHDHENLPVLVAGTAGGAIPSGRHYAFPSNTPCDGLYVTLLNALGVPTQTFGEKQSGPQGWPA